MGEVIASVLTRFISVCDAVLRQCYQMILCHPLHDPCSPTAANFPPSTQLDISDVWSGRLLHCNEVIALVQTSRGLLQAMSELAGVARVALELKARALPRHKPGDMFARVSLRL